MLLRLLCLVQELSGSCVVARKLADLFCVRVKHGQAVSACGKHSAIAAPLGSMHLGVGWLVGLMKAGGNWCCWCC